MSKVIKITENEIEEIKQEFFEALEKSKLPNGKFTFSKTVGEIDRKADLFYTEKAWIKQQALIDNFSDEVAWHGIAKRGEDESVDEYIIEDILVYPQEVTGATVNTDQEEYQNWLYEHDDEVFDNIRMQGHSHVNMGVTPSGVDDSLYERILGQLDDEMFYIFLIWNKKGDKTVKIYDLAKNVLFETADVDVGIIEEEIKLDEFLSDAKEKVKRKAATNYGYTGNRAVMNSKKTKKKGSRSYSREGAGSGYYSDGNGSWWGYGR